MDHAIGGIFEVVFTAGCAQVPICVPVALEVSIDSCCQSIGPNVKLSVFIKQRPFDVFLNNVGPLVAVDLLSLDQRLNMTQVAADLNTTPSIGVLSRLDNPERRAILGVLLKHICLLYTSDAADE